MICADDAVFNHKDAVEMARSLADAQMRKIAAAIDQVLAGMPQAATTCILSGHGDFWRSGLGNTGRFPHGSSLSPKNWVRTSRDVHRRMRSLCWPPKGITRDVGRASGEGGWKSV